MIGERAVLTLGVAPRPLAIDGTWLTRAPVTLWIGRADGSERPHEFGTLGEGEALFGGSFIGDGGVRYVLCASSAPEIAHDVLALDVLAPNSRDDILARYVRFVLNAFEADEVTPDRFFDRDSLDVDDGELVQSRRRVAFARITAGRALYGGIVPLAAGEIVPFAEGIWIRTDGPCSLTGVGRNADLTPTDFAASIATVQKLLGALWIDREKQSAVTRAAGLAAAAQHERDVLARELTDLQTVLRRDDLRLGDAADPVFAAAVILAHALDVHVVEPSTRSSGFARLQAIADASHLALRQVMLTPDWQHREIAPFVAFRSADESAIAVVPRREGGYELVDPRTASRTVVDDRLAAELPAEVYTLLRPFPDRPLHLWELVRFALRGSRGDLAATAGLALFGAVLAASVPAAISIVFDAIVPQAIRGQLGVIMAALVIFALLSAGSEFVRGMLIVRMQARLTSSLEIAMMERLIALPASFFRRFGVGDLASRVVGVDQIEQYISDVTVGSILGGVFSIVSLGLVFAFDVRLGFVALLLGVTAGVVQALQVALAATAARRLASQTGAITNDVLQMIDGVAKLKIAHAEIRAYARWLARFAEQRRTIVENAKRSNAFVVFAQTWPVASGFALIAWAALSVHGPINAGAFLAASAALGQFVTGLLGLGTAAATAARAVPIYERTRPILDAVPERQVQRRDPGALGGAVELNDVTFRYAATGTATIAGLSLDVRPGEYVAFVGPSGSGKSTLLRLLLGFEEPESGSVLYDGRDLRALDVGAVRRQIGTVLQGTRLIPGSIYDNIAAGRIITLDEAWDAARAVGLAPDIGAMPMKMQTYVDASGGAFSGGQRQRIAIARALVNAPRILYFDEATSALDNATQAVVTETLAALHVTRIVIAHRLSTIAAADRVIVVDGGRIVEAGAPAALMASGGAFARLAQRQLI